MFKKILFISLFTICIFGSIICVLNYSSAADTKHSKVPNDANQVFDALTSNSGKTSRISATSVTLSNNLVVAFSPIPLEIKNQQEYFVIVSLTWVGKNESPVKFEVDAISKNNLKNLNDINTIPFGSSKSIPMGKIEQIFKTKQSSILIPHASLQSGSYTVRFGFNGSVFSSHDIRITN